MLCVYRMFPQCPVGKYASAGIGCLSCPPYTYNVVNTGALTCVPICPVMSQLTTVYGPHDSCCYQSQMLRRICALNKWHLNSGKSDTPCADT